MSYVRFGSDGSDVYVFDHVAGHIECCYCSLLPRDNGERGFFECNTSEEMIAHLNEHIQAGHCVPDWVIEFVTKGRNLCKSLTQYS